MFMQEELFQQLLEKYITNSITAAERQQFMQFLNEPAYRQLLEKKMDEQLASGELNTAEDLNTREFIFKQLQNMLGRPATPVRKMFPWKRFAVAASILFVLGLGYLRFFNNEQKTNDREISGNTQHDVNPGSFKAKLTLANGSIIVLDSAAIGQLAKQGNTSITHQDGKLTYDAGAVNGEMIYNTVSTSNGETFSLKLADGSVVYLNSASSVKFPVAFSGTERRIEITGEAYFSVAKNPNQPFIVSVSGMDVQALGTEFNINAYADETTLKTTLVEGSVKVSSTGNPEPVIIKPGQQTNLKGSNISVASDVNIDEVIAWKDGFFHLESTDLKMLLRQFARWYDVEVIYEGEVSQDKFFVIVSRKSSLSSVLKVLQANGVNSRIEGKKLFVQPR